MKCVSVIKKATISTIFIVISRKIAVKAKKAQKTEKNAPKRYKNRIHFCTFAPQNSLISEIKTKHFSKKIESFES